MFIIRGVMITINYQLLVEGSLEVKLPTIWTDEKQRWEESEEERRSKSERLRRKKVQVREKIGKSRNTVFFQWFVALEGRKVGSLKRRVRSNLARWKMKNCTPLWREAHFQVKMYKTPQLRNTFGSWDVEKVHAVVARSTFRSQNVKNTTARDCAPCQKWAKREGFVAFPKTMAGVGHLKRICKDAFSVAGAVQETCLSSQRR